MLEQHNGFSVLDHAALDGSKRVFNRHLENLDVFPFCHIATAIASLTLAVIGSHKEVESLCYRTWTHKGLKDTLDARYADGFLSEDEGDDGSRTYMNLGSGLNRPRASETDPPSFLEWTTAPLGHDVDVVGPIELQLDAACSAPDTAFIAFLQDVCDDGNATNITAGYLRAGLRKVDEEQSKKAAPALPWPSP